MEEPAVVFLHDSANVRQFAYKTLGAHGYRVMRAATPQEALRQFDELAPDFIVISELEAGSHKTISWLSEILFGDSSTRVMVIPRDSLPSLRMPELSRRTCISPPFESEIVGESSVMVKLRKYLDNVAQSQCGVLITGETGTGKELVAAEIHRRSQRRSKQLVAINCAAIPDTLLESELFGVERGAYTGAHSGRDGKLQAANGGTLFLDELSELSLLAQAKLLRVLETHQVERLGGGSSTQLDVRVLAASNQSLLELVSQGRFRKDLYYRLAVCQIQMPPLRERIEDIPLLSRHLLRTIQGPLWPCITGCSSETMTVLQSHNWPGNIRELRNVLEAVTIDKSEGTIKPEELPSWFSPCPLSNTLVAGRQQLVTALEKAGWNKARAARDLRCSRMTLYRQMSKHNIQGGAGVSRRGSITGGAKRQN